MQWVPWHQFAHLSVKGIPLCHTPSYEAPCVFCGVRLGLGLAGLTFLQLRPWRQRRLAAHVCMTDCISHNCQLLVQAMNKYNSIMILQFLCHWLLPLFLLLAQKLSSVLGRWLSLLRPPLISITTDSCSLQISTRQYTIPYLAIWFRCIRFLPYLGVWDIK